MDDQESNSVSGSRATSVTDAIPRVVQENVKARKKWSENFTYGKPVANIIIWLVFCVAIALVPVFSVVLASALKGQALNWEKALAHGELLAICVALTGEAMRYLMTNSNVSNLFKQVVGAGCVLLFLGSALSLGTIASESTTASKSTIQPDAVMHLSLLFFAGTLLVGCFCKWTER